MTTPTHYAYFAPLGRGLLITNPNAPFDARFATREQVIAFIDFKV